MQQTPPLLQYPLRAQQRNVILGEVNARLNACNRSEETRADLRDLRRECAPDALPRGVGGAGALRRDELHDALSAREIEAAVQKGALGELSRRCRTRSCLPCAEQRLAQNNAAAVALQLNGILPCVGMRRTHIEEDALVDHSAVRGRDVAVARRVGGDLPEHAARRRAEYSTRNRERLCAAHADDADASRPARRRNLADGVLDHARPPLSTAKKRQPALPFLSVVTARTRSPRSRARTAGGGGR